MKKTTQIFILLLCNISFAQTIITGIIAENRTLTKLGSPYNIGKALVPAGVTLTIEAGVTINISFQRGYENGYSNEKQLMVEGCIIAKGTDKEPITINGNFKIGYDTTMGGKRPAISQPRSSFDHCVFNEEVYEAIYTYHNPIKISNCNIKGRIYVHMSEVQNDKDESEITNTTIGARLSASNGKITIENCKIFGREHAIHQSEVILHNNIISGKGTESTRYGFMIVGKKVTISNNDFEYQKTDALCIYPNLKNNYIITNNVFKHNQTNLRLDIISIKSETLAAQIGTNCFIEKNEFHLPTHKQVIVSDHESRNARGEFVVMDLKNNFWANLDKENIYNYILDNRLDYQQRVKINVEPYITKENYVAPTIISVQDEKTDTEEIPYEYPLFFYEENLQDAESYIEYTFENHHYKLPIPPVTEAELINIMNNYGTLTKDQLAYVTIKKDGKYHKSNFITAAGFDQKRENLMATWNFNFLQLNLNTIKLPYKLSNVYIQNQAYGMVYFSNAKGTISNFSITITKFDNQFMYGKFAGKSAKINGEASPINGTFKFKLY
jgi:hypothetical protein